MFLPKSKKRYFAFLFSDRFLKVAKMGIAGGKLDSFFECALPPNLINLGEVVNSAALGEFLAKVKSQIKINHEYVIVGISDHKAVNHTLILPQMEIAEIDQAVKREASDFLPFPYKDEYLDWMLIESLANGDKKILILAIPKATIDAYKEAFKKAALSPIAFETWSLSLFREVPKNDTKLSFALEIGLDASVLILIKDGSIEATSVIKDNSSLLDHLDKMKKFYTAGQDGKSAPINIYLSGKGADSDTAERIKTNLSLNPLALTPQVANIPNERRIELALLISLAQKNIRQPEDEKTINILPEDLSLEYAGKEEEKKEKLLKTVLTALFIFCVLAVFGAFFYLQRQKTLLEKTLSKDETKKILDLKSVPVGRAALIVEKEREKQNLVEMLSFAVETASGTVQLTGVKYDREKKEINLAGLSPTRDTLLLFREKLTENKLYKKVLVPLSSLGTTYTNDFRISINF